MEIKIEGEVEKRNRNILFALIVLTTILSLWIKLSYIDYIYSDYVVYLSAWVEEIKQNGYLYALAEPFYNYTTLYMYVLAIIAKLDVNSLYAIKLVSIFFEYVAIFYVGRIAYLVTRKELAKWIPFAIIPLLPSVIFNSTMMSQCDSIYVSFAFASIYYLFKKKQITSMILLGIAFSLKLQTVFIFPFYFVYMLRGHIKWYLFLIIPVVYVVTILPVWIAGRPFFDLLGIYVMQGGYDEELVMSIPSVYIFIKKHLTSKLLGMAIVFVLVCVCGYLLKNKKYKFTIETWTKLLFLSALICPYLLPGMHERYIYMAELLAVVYVLISWKNVANWLVALVLYFISYYSYSHALSWGLIAYPNDFPMGVYTVFDFITWQWMSFIYLMLNVYVVYDLVKSLKQEKGQREYVGESSLKSIDIPNS